MSLTLNSILFRLCTGELTSSKLPAIIDLGDFVHEFDDLWERSIRDIEQGIVVECGRVLVLDQAGTISLVNTTTGEANQVELNLEIETNKLFVGTFHTHPHVSGVRGAAFGVCDFTLAINSKSALTLVHSGRYLYALVRTEFTPMNVDIDSLSNEFDEIFIHARAQGYTTLESLLETNLQLCEQYGLAFYYAEASGLLQEIYRP